MILAVGLVVTTVYIPVKAQSTSKKSGRMAAGNAEAGKSSFIRAGCQTCHGPQGLGTEKAPPIAPPTFQISRFVSYVRQPSGKMPAVGVDIASNKELTDIFAFLESAAPASSATDLPAGDPANGKRLFMTYGCYECHGTGGQGGVGPRIGPPTIPTPAIARYVRHPTAQMPPYSIDMVSDQELADICAFLRAIPPPPAADIPLLR
jgi:mono/diheme cytochrome c family protein